MKHILVTLLLLFSLLSQAQEQLRNFGIAEVFRGGDSIFIKKLTTVVIKVTDGLVTKQDTNIDSARLFISGDGALYQGVITWKKVGGVVVPPVPSVLGSIDNIDSRTRYAGTWQQFNNAVFHNGTSSYSAVTNATITITFIGKQIEWWTEETRNKGIAGISIDGVAEVDVDIYASTTVNNTQKVWTSPVLSPGEHTLRIRVTGLRNDLATENTLIHDRILVIQ